MNVSGRVALVTGGGQGIGRSIAEKLASYGADVVIIDVNLEKAQEAADAIKAMGRKSMALKVDVTSLKDCEEMAERVFKEMEAIHILVNNAGITRDGLILRMTEQDWDAVLNVNLKGAFNCTKAVLKYMTKMRWGRIINIASVVGEIGNAGQANYSASKAGLIGLTKTVAREFASRNITCNAVAPGFIETAMTDALSDKVKEELMARIPLGRLGGPADVANGVLFLASNASSYITGHVIDINGGMAM
ncbi:MAG TPA: 3-oxoacyl-ACP reductase [Deltaproteobacteria bacterium]|nr:MAG: 3-oxoacyl-[acyl-carrier-protein] reductase [Deltaproteobacteria bacterium GWA2_55_82]OGQ63883.1 MAG: 3-oxoacyl-[acyl-carrier-protein] reductase [Deltaproteobacteria bacterium RIFCSPLOWO2_02_FULL_55_12]OIJ72655.1 MAG: 3-oxoacyl-[acyl-carrier-protein] reductase [Deltaproteobacteria bacterium GWC2_55_46]HBG47557.1 3-oxoacyl-ACP reductase [Deltaproteobacteria bacterium]HCY10468.1 3-oxoacyl-ACP reductase [Deltaproteobacteria bacterium]